jgi:PKD repeat protein
VEVTFSSTNNPDDSNEVGFITTVENLQYGENTITVVATDTSGKTASVERIVIRDELNGPPEADAGGPYEGDEGTSILFDASSSSDPQDDELKYRWDFDNDGTWDTSWSTDPTASRSWSDEGTHTVAVQVFDGELTDTATASVTVTNAAPELSSFPSYSTEEGSTIVITFPFTDAGVDDTHTALIEWGDGDSDEPSVTESGGSGSFPGSHAYSDNGDYVATVTVTDNDGDSDEISLSIQVSNVPPYVSIVAQPEEIDEGGYVKFSGSFDDPGDDTHTFLWEFGDSSSATDSLEQNHQYDDEGEYEVSLTVTDDDGGTGTAGVTITVNNVAPTATFGDDGPKDEGDKVTVSFSNQYDPGTSDTFTYSFDWDNDGVFEVVDQSSASASNTWKNEGEYVVSGRIKDNDGGCSDYRTIVIVWNVAPSIDSFIVSPTEPVKLGNDVTVTAKYSDPGDDTLTTTIHWGDGKTSTVTGYEIGVTHEYAATGVYTITLEVTDGVASVETTYRYAVVYDPEDGFVTGGGWIDSPEGAYVADETLSGKANFGFVSKYKKGATVPTGNVEFQFKVGDLNFHSKDFDWLVIAGSKAKFKGTGTINGEGSFGFMISAIDGNDDGVDDTFRIKIWDKANDDAVVYDNQIDADDDAAPTTALGGGQIVIHNPK